MQCFYRPGLMLFNRYHWKFHWPTSQPGRWCVR